MEGEEEMLRRLFTCKLCCTFLVRTQEKDEKSRQWIMFYFRTMFFFFFAFIVSRCHRGRWETEREKGMTCSKGH